MVRHMITRTKAQHVWRWKNVDSNSSGNERRWKPPFNVVGAWVWVWVWVRRRGKRERTHAQRTTHRCRSGRRRHAVKIAIHWRRGWSG